MGGKERLLTRKILQWGCLVPTALVLFFVAWWGASQHLVARRAERARAGLRVGMPVADVMKMASSWDWDVMFAESGSDTEGNYASFSLIPNKEGGWLLLQPGPSRRVSPEEVADMIKKNGRRWRVDFGYSAFPKVEFSVTFSPHSLVQNVSALRNRD